MTKWERFGDDTWINVDHVEVLRVEEQDDGRWHLTAAFASGRTYPVGTHDDRELLTDCTDALLRGQVSERLQALSTPESTAEPTPEPTAAAREPESRPVKRRWTLRRSPASKSNEGRRGADPVPSV